MSGTFYLAGLSEVKDTGDALHFIAQTYSDDDNQRSGIAYYLDKRVLDQAQSPRDILKLLLENLFKEIDRGYID